MKKPLLIALTICVYSICICTTVLAQIKQIDIPANILLNNGKEVSGFIKENTLAEMDKGIQFRTPSEQSWSTYKLTDFKKIQIDGKETYHVLDCTPAKDTVQIKMLGALILKGGVSAYELNYNRLEVYLIEKNGRYYWLQDDVLKDYEMHKTKYFFKNILYQVVMDGGITEDEIKKVTFNENTILAVITKYNQNKNYNSEVIPTYNLKKTSFIIGGISANPLNKDDYEIMPHISYRLYIPRLSKTTSFNLGLQYSYRAINEHYTDKFNNPQVFNSVASGVFMPLFVQQNFLNKSVRPYLKVGVSLTYLLKKDLFLYDESNTGFQRSYGIGLLYGLGVEVDIYKGLMFKSDAYIDVLKHLVTAGIAYRWPLN